MAERLEVWKKIGNQVRVSRGDSLRRLKKLEDNSIDSLACDPPAGISFMGREWDSDKGGRRKWSAWLANIMAECLRVLKPGAHGVIWALPRTVHWTMVAVEDAGFEIRDILTHVFGSGFPKNHDVSKAIDKQLGAEREKVPYASRLAPRWLEESNKGNDRPLDAIDGEDVHYSESDVPVTEEGAKWHGWGTALKPAHEMWILVRKPLSEKNVACNVLKWGTGAINIAACRIGDADTRGVTGSRDSEGWGTKGGHVAGSACGRYPSNFILSQPMDVILDNQSGISKSSSAPRHNKNEGGTATEFGLKPFTYVPSFGDGEGGASRFFIVLEPESLLPFYYCPKPSAREKNRGCKQLDHRSCGVGALRDGGRGKKAKNTHPTVKAVALMEYLIRMITPSKGIVLDPFMGSGSTGVAAVKKGFRFVGVDMSREYYNIAVARLRHTDYQYGQRSLRARVQQRRKTRRKTK